MTDEEKIEAIRQRNAKCDGLFYYGVKSTGIVCKPSCKAKEPMVKNIVLFDSLEDALNHGFRKCKICFKNEE